MMKRRPDMAFRRFRLPLLLLALAVALYGCGRKTAETVPSGRNQLIIRIFQSLERDDFAAAAEQAAKLKALDPGNEYLGRIIDTQRANRFVRSAQELFDAGEYQEALQTLEQGLRQLPLDNNLKDSLEQLQRIVALESAFRSHTAAGSLAVRRRTLEKLEAEAESFRSVPLNSAIVSQRELLDRLHAEEVERLKPKPAPAPAAPDVEAPGSPPVS